MLTLIRRLFRPFFIGAGEHAAIVSNILAESTRKGEEVAILQAELRKAERTKHQMANDLRSLLSSTAIHVRRTDPARGDRLHFIGHVMPYLIKGDDHFTRDDKPDYTQDMRKQTVKLAAEYDFALPGDPEKAVQSMVYLAAALLEPSHYLQLNSIRHEHRLTAHDKHVAMHSV